MKLPIPGPGYTTGRVSKAKPPNKATSGTGSESFAKTAHPAGKVLVTITRKGSNIR